uniref:PAP-associated domain-containing protein n=1 Tax=Globodera pallida TaxID=36090 RepID=A0A183C6G0_GLOPA
MSADDLCQQMNERMAADISVWMRWLQRQQSDRWKGAGAEEIVRESFEILWLYYRIKYDSFKCQYLPPEEVAQFSYQLVSLVQRVKEFTLNDKNKHLEGPKLENCWINIKELANSEGRIQWINSGGKAAPPSTAFAQWHFEELQKYSTDGEQSDEEANEMFQKIIKGLNENRDHRKKLTQLLKLEDIKKLFNLHKIEFDKNDFIGEMKFVENLENHLTKEAKSEDGNNVKEQFDRKIKESLKKIHKIVDKWSDKRARLLISGSFLLGSYTFCSDVDLICLVPRKTVTQMDFFANNQTICVAGKCTPPSNDTNRSLFCRLCTNANVRGLVKINYGTVFLIKFQFDGIEFDLTFVSIPSRKDLPVQINDESIKSFFDKFASGNADDAKMLRVLSSYRSVRYVANLLSLDTANGDWTRILNDDAAGGGHHQKSSKISKKFRNLLLSLKLWAKKKFIYSNRFALNDIRSMGIGNYFDWALTNSTPFTEKFDYFILVNCAGEMEIDTDKFCQFVDGRIRLEFVYEIGIETRLYPNYFGQTCQMPKHFEAFNGKGIVTNYCKVWLAGVNIPLSSAPDYLGESLSKMLNGFDLAIKRAYLRFNPNNDAVQNQKSESDDIQTIYRKLKFDLKSLVVERRSLIEEL